MDFDSNIRQKSTGHNSIYPKGGVSSSKDSFEVNESLVCQSSFVVKVPPFG
jgi:hypothetical protein